MTERARREEDGRPADDERELSLELPAVHDAVRFARRVLRHFARLAGTPDREVETIALAASELLGNAIDHAGAPRGERGGARMRLALRVSARGWRFRVTDEAGGDPRELEEHLGSGGAPALEGERGRGLFLVAELVDELDVRRSREGRGLTIVAIRRYGSR